LLCIQRIVYYLNLFVRECDFGNSFIEPEVISDIVDFLDSKHATKTLLTEIKERNFFFVAAKIRDWLLEQGKYCKCIVCPRPYRNKPLSPHPYCVRSVNYIVKPPVYETREIVDVPHYKWSFKIRVSHYQCRCGNDWVAHFFESKTYGNKHYDFFWSAGHDCGKYLCKHGEIKCTQLLVEKNVIRPNYMQSLELNKIFKTLLYPKCHLPIHFKSVYLKHGRK
jgi:hypothetical protein